MKITYDHEADALYIGLIDKKPFDTIELESGTLYEVDERGRLLGIEILDASKKYQDIDNIDYEQYLKATIVDNPNKVAVS